MQKTFGELKIGERFFDCESGDFYRKTSDRQGEYLLENGDAWAGSIESFDADELVETDE